MLGYIEQAKALIDNSVGSIYSKNDVLAILDRIENFQVQTAFEISDEMRDRLVDGIVKDVVSSIENVECVDGWDLSMSYNEVTVDSPEVNESDVEDIVGKWVNKWVNDVNGMDSDCGC